MNERMDAHVVATSKVTDRISEEMNARSGRLLDGVKEYRIETENSLTLRRLMSYIYMEHPFLMFLDHTQRRTTVGRTPLDE